MPDNNLIEQDHRRVKLRIGPMLGFKWFRTAAITIAGVELLIRKNQFDRKRVAPKRQNRARHVEGGVGGVTNTATPQKPAIIPAQIASEPSTQACKTVTHSHVSSMWMVRGWRIGWK